VSSIVNRSPGHVCEWLPQLGLPSVLVHGTKRVGWKGNWSTNLKAKIAGVTRVCGLAATVYYIASYGAE
jgi:hypothetical protein